MDSLVLVNVILLLLLCLQHLVKKLSSCSSLSYSPTEELRRAGWAGSLCAPSLSEAAAPQAAMEGAGSGMWSFCRGSPTRPAGWLFSLGLAHGYCILPTGKALVLKQSEEQEKMRGAPCPQLTRHPGRWFHALLAIR